MSDDRRHMQHNKKQGREEQRIHEISLLDSTTFNNRLIHLLSFKVISSHKKKMQVFFLILICLNVKTPVKQQIERVKRIFTYTIQRTFNWCRKKVIKTCKLTIKNMFLMCQFLGMIGRKKPSQNFLCDSSLTTSSLFLSYSSSLSLFTVSLSIVSTY